MSQPIKNYEKSTNIFRMSAYTEHIKDKCPYSTLQHAM